MQLRVGSCPSLNMLLNGVRSPCKVCSLYGAISKDTAKESLVHIFNCPGMLPLKFLNFEPEMREADDLNSALNALPPANSMSYSDLREQKKLRARLDKVEFSPRLLWSNIRMALRYIRLYTEAGRRADILRSATGV